MIRATIVLAITISLLVAGVAGPVTATASGSIDAAAPSQEVDGEPVFDDPDELEAFVDDVVAEQREEHDVPGVTVSVVEGEETVLAKGYGDADAATGTPVEANETAFMVGSVSKLVTWTAVMQGVEDGKLDLDEDVNTYLENSEVEVPEAYDEPVTLRHLGTHTTGFDPALVPGIVEDGEEVTSLETALAENEPDRIEPPGETVAYSNYGTVLAGHVVAEAYETTFEEYVQSEVFEPLEMDHSTFAQPVPEDHPGELAAPHEPTGEPADRTYINWRPAGSMSATATDMATFTSAHLEDGAVDDARILELETVETMHDTHHERHEAVNDWRYGFYEYGAADTDLVAHSGGTMHETTKLVLAPEDDVGIFVSYNVRNQVAPPNVVVDAILGEYGLQPEPETPEDGELADGASDRAETLAGEYRASMVPSSGPEQVVDPMVRLSVDAASDGTLESDTLGMDEREWVEVEPYVYHEVDGHDVLVFEVEDGEVEALHRNSMPMLTYEPVPTHERTIVVGGLAGIALVGFALSLVGWIGLAGWRRVRGWRTETAPSRSGRTASGSFRDTLENRLRRPSWLARAAGIALPVLSLAFVAGFLWGFALDEEFAFVTMPVPFRVALSLPPLVGVVTAATVVGTVVAWQRGYWSRRARIHQTLLAVLGLAFCWVLLEFGFFGV
ncbi:serine hydrolase domain-containing protein [Natronobacterium texcoconense]|uniref:serine hydrolase domain-containing protein n=1 Tax=Natronobacterium texcoconense TaxID=1095778 RepID=UPI00147D110D|nr:serine hydrolase domain-containing protein [Natronobacterium texcoconense]